jgi:hypothetical protein
MKHYIHENNSQIMTLKYFVMHAVQIPQHSAVLFIFENCVSCPESKRNNEIDG